MIFRPVWLLKYQQPKDILYFKYLRARWCHGRESLSRSVDTSSIMLQPRIVRNSKVRESEQRPSHQRPVGFRLGGDLARGWGVEALETESLNHRR